MPVRIIEPEDALAPCLTLYRLAADNLRLGHTVVADSVNPLEITRNAFRNVAAEARRSYIEVEIFCSDSATLRHRAETRSSTVEGLIQPSWDEIQALHYERWEPDLRVDTFHLSVAESVAQIASLLSDDRNGPKSRQAFRPLSESAPI